MGQPEDDQFAEPKQNFNYSEVPEPKMITEEKEGPNSKDKLDVKENQPINESKPWLMSMKSLDVPDKPNAETKIDLNAVKVKINTLQSGLEESNCFKEETTGQGLKGDIVKSLDDVPEN